MTDKHLPLKTMLSTGSVIAALSILPSVAFAQGSGAIYVSPLNTTAAANQPFEVSVIASGGGQAFNAVGANLTLSNLTVESITPGDCNLTLLKSFTTTDPSFAGGYLNGSSAGCKVYTMQVIAKDQGVAKISFVNGTMKSAATSADMLSTLAGATYTIKGTAASVPMASQPPLSSYTIQVKVVDAANQPVSKANLILVKNPPVIAVTDTNGMATFPGLAQGVYSLSAVYQGEKKDLNVVVDGQNPNVSAQIKLAVTLPGGGLAQVGRKAAQQPLIAIVIGLLALIVAALIALVITRSKKHPTT